MERFLKYVRNQRNLNSFKIGKVGKFLEIYFFQRLFSPILGFCKNTETFAFRKIKNLLKCSYKIWAFIVLVGGGGRKIS